MHRYIALIWDSESERSASAATAIVGVIRQVLGGWELAFERDGLIALHTGHELGKSQSYKIGRDGGVVLGKLFSKVLSTSEAPTEVSLHDLDARKVCDSGGRYLIQSYWGRYVAFFLDKANDTGFALRDPSGGMLCNSMKIDGVSIYFSHVRDLYGIRGLKFSVNWDYIIANFVTLELVNEKTSFNEILELEPGECHVLKNSKTERQFLWQPKEVYLSGSINRVNEAIELLRERTQSCINAWAATYSSIAHNLSGGLDSAIVLGCLVRAPIRQKISCLNYYTETKEGDERPFARAAAKLANLDLHEVVMPGATTKIEDLVNGIPLTERPDLTMYGAPVDRMQMEFARDRDADAFTSGEGGDHIFYAMDIPVIAADHIWDNGLSAETIDVILKVARLRKLPFWTVFRVAMIHGLMRRRFDPVSLYRGSRPPFLKESAVDTLRNDYADHPWSHDGLDLPPGKYTQIDMLAKVLHRHPSFGRPEVADVVHPLFSQPLVEACLKIPSYIATIGGRNRGLARLAFADIVPKEIIERRSKGVTSTYFSRMYTEGLPFIREYILDGVFAKTEFVDRIALDSFLSLETIANTKNIRPVFKLIAVEAWLRRLDQAKQRIAA